jgi:hypothetical protein
MGAEGVAKLLQFVHEFYEIVDLTVIGNDYAPVFIEQRLLPGREVNDGQPAVPESKPGLKMKPAFVRPTVVLRLVHPVEKWSVNFALTQRIQNADYSTHDLLTP